MRELKNGRKYRKAPGIRKERQDHTLKSWNVDQMAGTIEVFY